ncbi:MAG: beta-ketoacyl-ACP synthase, partial [Acetobacteraceae bacterium]|nr:beta-ketoacyl-ACP synthase [Acetobacteraceae bacterium]
MSADLDKAGRPVVVVTGIGVLTSLGEGVEENWARLTEGRSGIRRITRFPLDGLRTTIAGAVDFVPADSSAALAEEMARRVAAEAVAGAGIGSKGDFPGPLFLALAPVELEWTQRRALAEAAGGAPGYEALLRAADTAAFTSWHARFLFGSVAEA